MDKKISAIMANCRLQMPASGFEDKLMDRIRRHDSYRKAVFKDLRLSCIFFVLAAGLGGVINFFLTDPGHAVAVASGKTLWLFQVPFVVLFLLQLEKIIQLISKLKNS